MTITTLSSREFNQNVSRAKKAAELGPVFITDHGKRNIADAVAMPGVADIEFEPFPKRGGCRAQ